MMVTFQDSLNFVWCGVRHGVLNRYLDEPLYVQTEEEGKEPFDILKYWRENESRFPPPRVARMAADHLHTPTSSVPSEATFSTGGRVADDHRASLDPATVETLMLGSSWDDASEQAAVWLEICR